MPDIAIDALSDADARKLYDQLGFRFSRTSKDMTADETLVWNAMCQVLATPSRPCSPFLKAHGKALYASQVKALISYMHASVAAPLRRGEELALMTLIIRCIVAWLMRGDTAIMPSTILNSVDYVSSAVDKSYPGYSHARMLGYLVQAAA